MDLNLMFPIQSCHRGWKPHVTADACNCFLQLWGELLSKRLEDFPFLLLNCEGFSLQMQLQITGRSGSLSCRFKYFIFLQALPVSLCSEKWARVREVQGISVKACDQKFHFCSLTAGVQGRVYIFTFNQPWS